MDRPTPLNFITWYWDLVVWTSASLGLTAAGAPLYRPRFRGPNSQGAAENARPPVDFGP